MPGPFQSKLPSLPAWAKGVINPNSRAWLQTQADQGQQTTRKQFDAHLNQLSSDWFAANPNYQPMMPWDNNSAGADGGNIPQGIPGTASSWTLDNPGPSGGRDANAMFENWQRNRHWAGGANTPVNPLTGQMGQSYALNSGMGGAPVTPAPTITPNRWFQNPWQTQVKRELPFWMKGFNYGG